MAEQNQIQYHPTTNINFEDGYGAAYFATQPTDKWACEEKMCYRDLSLLDAAKMVWEDNSLSCFCIDLATEDQEGKDLFEACWGREVRGFQQDCQSHNVLNWNNLKLLLHKKFKDYARDHPLELRFDQVILPPVTLDMLEQNRSHIYQVLFFCYTCYYSSLFLHSGEKVPDNVILSFPCHHPYILIPSLYFQVICPREQWDQNHGAFSFFWQEFEDLFKAMNALQYQPNQRQQPSLQNCLPGGSTQQNCLPGGSAQQNCLPEGSSPKVAQDNATFFDLTRDEPVGARLSKKRKADEEEKPKDD